MELTHEDIQKLHSKVREWKDLKPETKVEVESGGQEYEIITSIDSVTEAVAVAPVVNGQTDYSNTIVLTAGTQDKLLPGINPIVESFKTVLSLYGAGHAAYWGEMSPQYKEMDEFYSETQNRLKDRGVEGGQIHYSSAHSQAGVPSAKLSVKYNVKEIVNFYDWGAQNAVNKGAITSSEINYLNKHAVIYSDSGKAMTFMDGNGGAIPYGQLRVFEGVSHNIQTPKLKGDHLDIEWYLNNELFCSGMSQSQVTEIVRRRISKGKTASPDVILENYFVKNTDPNFAILYYQQVFGSFAPEYPEQIKINNEKISNLHQRMPGLSGNQLISLREELIVTIASNARLQGVQYETEIMKSLTDAKEKIEDHIKEVTDAAYRIGFYLSDAEVDQVLSEFTLESCWKSDIESATLEQASSYASKLADLAVQFEDASNKIVSIDKEQATQFGLSK